MWTIVVKTSKINPVPERVIGIFASAYHAERYAASVLPSNEYYFIREIKGVYYTGVTHGS